MNLKKDHRNSKIYNKQYNIKHLRLEPMTKYINLN